MKENRFPVAPAINLHVRGGCGDISGEELAPTRDSGFQLARPYCRAQKWASGCRSEALVCLLGASGGHLAGHLGSLGGRRLAFGLSWEELG